MHTYAVEISELQLIGKIFMYLRLGATVAARHSRGSKVSSGAENLSNEKYCSEIGIYFMFWEF
jgi:hypothetical protein